MRRALLLAVAFAPAVLAADPALDALEACRTRLDARTDIGLERIERKCPELMPALEKAPWRNLLPPGMRDRHDEVSAESLRELGELVKRASRDEALRDLPDTKELTPVLAQLGEQGQQGATRWERFKRWLRDKLERRDDGDDEDSLFARLGRQFETSEGVARAITYTGYTLMGVLVAFIIWSELRAAGLIGAAARARRQQGPAAAWRRRLQLSDVANAPLAERPGMLLRLLGEALARAHRLPAPEGLTARGIARRAELDAEADRLSLTQVAGTAEAVRYGNALPDDRQLEEAADRARSLLAGITPKKAGD